MDSAARDEALKTLNQWYESYRPTSGAPPERFVICAGLMVLDRLRAKREIVRSDVVTPNNRARTNVGFIQGILKRYGETRVLAKEGGRTTASTVSAAESLYPKLNGVAELRVASDNVRQAAIDGLQEWLAERATEYLDQKKIEVEINISRPTHLIVRGIVDAAGNKAGAVAQHLVGAKLALRYEGTTIKIGNESHTTADEQRGRQGDFVVNQAAFHVTMAPALPVIQKCARNLTAGYMPHLIVPEKAVAGARYLASNEGIEDRMTISSIEQFVGQNLDEMSEFNRAQTASMFRQLLETYNERVRQSETDQSLQIEIPENLM